MLMRMQVRPLLPSRGIPWLLQLGMAPCRGHCRLCRAWCSSGWGKRGAQAAFGTGPKSQDQTVHQTVFHRLDGPKFQKYGKTRRTVPSRPNRTANRLPYFYIPDDDDDDDVVDDDDVNLNCSCWLFLLCLILSFFFLTT